MKTILILVTSVVLQLSIFGIDCFAQFNQVNLVINPSIEMIDTCPSFWQGGDIQLLFGWDTIRYGDGSTPDVFNICYTQPNLRYAVPSNYWGFQYPRNGLGYAGLVGATNYSSGIEEREYMQGVLKQKLIGGKNYCVKVHVSLSERSEYSCFSFGAFLDDGTTFYPNHQAPFPTITPQVTNSIQLLNDTSNWMLIEGSFIANGTEEYITIGNFSPNNQSGIVHSYPSTTIPSLKFKGAYYYIDDVSVIDISTPAYAGNDTIIHAGDSIFIGRQPEVGLNEACIWFVNGTPIDTIAGLWVTPDTTTTYILQQTLCGNVSYDTVTVTIDFDVSIAVPPSGVRGLFKLYPNPNDRNMTLEYSLEANENGSLILYDMAGKIISRYNLDNAKSTLLLNEDSLQNGVYFYSVLVDGNVIETSRIVIIK